MFILSRSNNYHRLGIRIGLLVCGIVAINGSTITAHGQEADVAVVADEATPAAQPVTVTFQGGTTTQSTPPTGATQPGNPPAAGNAATPPAAAVQDTVKRQTADKYVPQKIDTEIRKNPDGLVVFNIVGQPWEAVLQWLSDASALSLDWQELPGDSLNLITTHEYTMAQARDLINRHLLMRGFTMIVNGEVMSIVRTKDLNPAMVVRVTPQELETLADHTICKVSFNLDWLVADEAVEELKPMLSSAGQIHKLSKTNRLEILDTAVSLRHIWELLQDEQSETGDDQLVRAFPLKHRRAEDVIRLLRELLKLQPPAGEQPQNSGGGMDPNMVMQMMQQMQQAMQQQAMQQQAGQAGAAKANAPKETRLVLNQRENTILAIAAPDQMAVIERALTEIDVPRDGATGLLQNISRMKIYRLESVDPQTLADLLQQIGDLDPGTVLKVDKSKKQIMAWATLADHLTITTLVEKMDQSSRQFEVITLKRLDSEYVAGTIRMLMDVEPKEENQNSNRRFYGYFDFNQQQQQTQKERSFRIEADTENNRLLVNANVLEMEEIRTLLIKLGELPDPNAADDGIRVFEVNPDEDLHELQRRLEQYWRRGNPLEFDLPKEAPKLDNESDAREKKTIRKKPAAAEDVTRNPSDSSRISIWKDGRRQPVNVAHATSSTTPASAFDELLRSTKHSSSPAHSPLSDSAAAMLTKHGADGVADESGSSAPTVPTETATPEETAGTTESPEPPAESEPTIDKKLIDRLRLQLQNAEPPAGETEGTLPTDPAAESQPAPQKDSDAAHESPVRDPRQSPIKFSVTPDGKLIASSRDVMALAELEALMGQVAAPRRSYKLFRLKYATPSWVTLNLKDFFKADEQTKSGFEYDPYWGIMPSQKKTKGTPSLSKRREPQFISDNFTSTILVRDADARQLQTIEDLIGIYDVPEPSDSGSMRVTTIFRLKHAKAALVAAAVKDVFRDLLSSNDKALETDDKGQRQSGGGGLVTFLPRGPAKEGSEGEEEEPIRFKGLLSMGIDDSSNTLIVSSSGSLMDTIGEMIESLDEAANSSSVVQVLHVDETVDLGLIQERLQELMKVSPAAQQPGQQPPQPGQPPGQQPPGTQPDTNPAAAGNQ